MPSTFSRKDLTSYKFLVRILQREYPMQTNVLNQQWKQSTKTGDKLAGNQQGLAMGNRISLSTSISFFPPSSQPVFTCLASAFLSSLPFYPRSCMLPDVRPSCLVGNSQGIVSSFLCIQFPLCLLLETLIMPPFPASFSPSYLPNNLPFIFSHSSTVIF